jgi:8-oxo-dGTP diphosphatase
LEVGEMLRDTAMREAREETGLLVEPSSLLGVYDRVLRDEQGRTMYHYVLVDFLCRRLAGEARAGGDAAEVARFSEDQIGALHLASDTEEVVRKGFELHRKLQIN